MGAEVVVIHCGYVEMKKSTDRLVKLCKNGNQLSNSYEKEKHKLLENRRKNVEKQLSFLCREIDRLLPILIKTNVKLGLENLPTWEAIPTEEECLMLIREFGNEHLCYWHDIGHAQIRENLGLINHISILKNMSEVLGGMHIHDVSPPVTDHLMPPSGNINFKKLKKFVSNKVIKVLEPSSRLSANDIKSGLSLIRKQWQDGE